MVLINESGLHVHLHNKLRGCFSSFLISPRDVFGLYMGMSPQTDFFGEHIIFIGFDHSIQIQFCKNNLQSRSIIKDDGLNY